MSRHLQTRRLARMHAGLRPPRKARAHPPLAPVNEGHEDRHALARFPEARGRPIGLQGDGPCDPFALGSRPDAPPADQVVVPERFAQKRKRVIPGGEVAERENQVHVPFLVLMILRRGRKNSVNKGHPAIAFLGRDKHPRAGNSLFQSKVHFVPCVVRDQVSVEPSLLRWLVVSQSGLASLGGAQRLGPGLNNREAAVCQLMVDALVGHGGVRDDSGLKEHFHFGRIHNGGGVGEEVDREGAEAMAGGDPHFRLNPERRFDEG
mmetsp:Transcript_52828/g.120421  ORF Transcript_52828/g.120421 Transcript_52828/m.120421 type:complete len:263 (+) Transcript_52828:574-1362(+)